MSIKHFLSGLCLSILASFSAFSQGYTPKDTWPYVYSDFVQGAAVTRNNTTLSTGLFNVCVSDGSLHFIKDEVIMKSDMIKVHIAQVGADKFLNVFGKMYKILSATDNGYVLEEITVDLEKMRQVKIGYGISSSTASANNYNGIDQSRVNTLDKVFVKAIDERANGDPLEIKSVIWIDVKGVMVQASKRGVLDCQYVDQKAAKAFLKSEKQNWKDVKYLEKVVDFISTQIQ